MRYDARVTEDRLASLLASLDEALQPLVLTLEAGLKEDPVDRGGLKGRVEAVLTYLSGPGLSEANCKGAALYFIVAKAKGLTRTHLPEDLRAIMDDLAGAMHDAVTAPKSAENFQATPELLLARLARLP